MRSLKENTEEKKRRVKKRMLEIFSIIQVQTEKAWEED